MTKKQILIIEDDVFLGDMLNQKLSMEGFDVRLERDGGSGLKSAQDHVPDLILLDIILPTMNGYEILEARQKDDRIRNVPVIIISNSGQPVEISRALALGVKDYMVKADLDPQDVVTKVKKFFEGTSTPTINSLTGRTVLWVEDDKFLRDLLSTKLTHDGCIALFAENGEQALNILQTEHPDVILLDLILPVMSGFDVLQHIKNDPKTKDIPVVVLSNTSQQSDMEKTHQLGAAKHLIKSQHDPDEIVKEVASVLR